MKWPLRLLTAVEGAGGAPALQSSRTAALCYPPWLMGKPRPGVRVEWVLAWPLRAHDSDAAPRPLPDSSGSPEQPDPINSSVSSNLEL